MVGEQEPRDRTKSLCSFRFLGRKWLVSFLRPVLVLQFFPFPLFPSPSLFSFLPCPQLLWYSFCYYDHIRSFDRSIRFVPRQAEKKTEKKDSEEELVPDTTSNRSSQDSEKKQGAKGLASAQVDGTWLISLPKVNAKSYCFVKTNKTKSCNKSKNLFWFSSYQ